MTDKPPQDEAIEAQSAPPADMRTLDRLVGRWQITGDAEGQIQRRRRHQHRCVGLSGRMGILDHHDPDAVVPACSSTLRHSCGTTL